MLPNDSFLKKNGLSIFVFLTGAAVLIVEIVAVRALSPYYGNTIFTVSSVITVVLAALSFGYYTGGKLADRHTELQWFFGIITASGLVLLALNYLGRIILPLLSQTLSITTGPLVFSLLLFFLPAFLLGMLSPFAIALEKKMLPDRGVGNVSGNIFFWSTLGSIAGSLSAGFFLIPHFGINRIMVATGALLFLIGFLPLVKIGAKKKNLGRALVAFLLISTAVFFSEFRLDDTVIFSTDGVYEKILIYDDVSAGRPARFLRQDVTYSAAMFLDTDDPLDLAFDYTKYYSLYKIFKPDISQAFVIGGGAYSVPKALLAEDPAVIVDVAEIEPSLFALMRTYFNVPDDPRLKNYIVDGRRFLADSGKQYDLIFSDAYHSMVSVPHHLLTKEFFTLAKERLLPDGIFIANVIGDLSRQEPSLIFSVFKTFRTVFPNSYFFADEPSSKDVQNILIVGYNSENKMPIEGQVLAHPDIGDVGKKQIDLERFDLSPYPILTDDFSPTEYLVSQALKRILQRKFLDGNEMLALISEELRFGARFTGSAGNERTREFLFHELAAITEDVQTEEWSHVGEDGTEYRLQNIIGRLFPEKEKRIILATHYDSRKFADKDPANPKGLLPGANDSASGVAVLIELARALAFAEEETAIGIDFVFFDGEEADGHIHPGLLAWQPLGSTYFSEHLAERYGNTMPVGGIVLDMVCDKDLNISKDKASFDAAPDEASAFWGIAQGENPSAWEDKIRREMYDDHTPLNEAGIPTFLLIDFDYPYFHTTEDTLDKCSAESLATVADAVSRYLYTLK